jgi:hypothetical protein
MTGGRNDDRLGMMMMILMMVQKLPKTCKVKATASHTTQYK